MSAVAKGKGKVFIPSGPIVIDSDEDDDEDPLAYFTFKRKPNQPLVKFQPADPEQLKCGGSDDDDDDEDGRKKRKKRTTKKQGPSLPEWTRATGSRERSMSKRASTEDRRSGEIIVLSSDEEGNMPKRSKGKGKERARRKSPELTPPPELTAEDRASINELLRRQFDADPTQVDAPEDPTTVASSSPSNSPPPQNSEEITIGVRMIADRETLPEGASERAIQQFEKRRSIRTYRYGKLDRLWHGLAERLSKKPEDIVLLHDGHQIYSRNMTPAQLDISDDSELVGYNKDHWDRLEAEKVRETQRLLNGTPPRSPSPSAATSASAAAPLPVAKKKISVCLRGEWGTVKMKTADFVKFSVLAQYYCNQTGKSLDLAPGLKLEFDGEVMDPESSVGDADMDEGDMIDVKV